MPFDGPDGYEIAVLAAARALRPPQRLRSSVWAAKHRFLPYGKNSQGGQWDPQRVPYLNAIMDACDDEHPAPTVVFIKPSQVGGTQLVVNVIGKTMHQAPRNILVLYPTEKDSRKWVRSNLNPMIKLTPALRAMLQSGRREDTVSTVTEKHFPHAILYTGSAGIAQDMAQISVGMVIFDDLDRMPKVIEGEGDPIELGKARLTTHARRKTIMISSPTTEDESRIWPEWKSSTQDHYHVPCVLCGHMQWLTFDNLIWPEGRPDLAVYQCSECEGEFPESHKRDLLNAGEWRAKHPEREEDVKGFSINGLYTPSGLGYTWIHHAKAWDLAKGKPAKVQVFYNTRRGDVVPSKKVKLEWEAVHARREPYKLRTIPPGVLMLTGSADIQGNRIEAMILGHGRGERLTIIDHQVLDGDPMRPEVWALLDDYFAGEIENSFGIKMRITCAMVDSGYLQHEVTNWTRERRGRNIFAAKGSKVPSRIPIGRPTYVDVKRGGKVAKRGAEQYQIGVGVLKTTLYARLTADAGEPEKPVLPADRLIHLSEDLHEEFSRQLCAEVRDAAGRWHKTYDHNEILDLVVLGMAASLHYSAGVDKMRESDWQRQEQLYEPKGGAAKPTDAVPAPVLPGGRFMPTAASSLPADL